MLKDADCYYKNPSTKSGLQSNCKSCQAKSTILQGIKKRKKSIEIDEIEGEIFKEFRPNYLISNFGRVYRREHTSSRYLSGKFLKTCVTHQGYLKVSVYQEHYLVHRLLAIEFIPNPKNKTQVNHKDSNRLNNELSNLEWVTPMENITHSAKLGRMSRKLTIKDVLSIRESSDSVADLAKKFGVTSVNIRLILNRKIWKHI